MPGKQELPSTLERSSKKAQRTWIKAHDSAVEEYGDGERAHRTAFAALKHSFEKVGDRWEAKDEKGPSDKQAGEVGSRSAEGRDDLGGGRRERDEGPPDGGREAARRLRTLPHEQGRAGRGDQEGEPQGDPREPQLTGLTTPPGAACSSSSARACAPSSSWSSARRKLSSFSRPAGNGGSSGTSGSTTASMTHRPVGGQRRVPGRVDVVGSVDPDAAQAEQLGVAGVGEVGQRLAGVEARVALHLALLPGHLGEVAVVQHAARRSAGRPSSRQRSRDGDRARRCRSSASRRRRPGRPAAGPGAASLAARP